MEPQGKDPGLKKLILNRKDQGFLCWLGFHDFHVINVSFGFGAGGNIEKLECQRCGRITTRQRR